MQRWCIKIIYDHIIPYLKIWPFKSHVSLAAVALYNSNVPCSTAFCLSDEKDLKLNGQHYSFCPFSLTIYYPEVQILDCVLGSSKIGWSIIHHTGCTSIISEFEQWKIPAAIHYSTLTMGDQLFSICMILIFNCQF